MKYYDRTGDEIDLSVIKGAYPTRAEQAVFLQKYTDYAEQERDRILDELERVTAAQMNVWQARDVRVSLEQDFEKELGIQPTPSSKRTLSAGKRVLVGLLLTAFVIGTPAAILIGKNKAEREAAEAAARAAAEQAASEAAAAAEDERVAALVTLDEFERVETDMSYESVVSIFGADGELLSSVDLFENKPQFKTETYAWDGYGGTGANCTVVFQGGKVTAKAQLGLDYAPSDG